MSHQDFTGRATPALDMTGSNPLECNGDLSCAGDRQGHGTHCAGTAAGERFGVAPQAAVRSIRVLDDEGGGLMSCGTTMHWIGWPRGARSVLLLPT